MNYPDVNDASILKDSGIPLKETKAYLIYKLGS